MRVLITGASGMVGKSLTRLLRADQHEVIGLSRPGDWDPDAGYIKGECLEGFDAVVHLAGENIAGGRWTNARKRRIFESRARGTQVLADALAQAKRPPKVLVSASAIGYYGDRSDEILTEQSFAGSGFLSDVCKAWEAATEPAAARGIRVVPIRIGIVLSADGGALAKMLLPFRMGVGGVLGDGRQYMSWITLADLCRAIHHVIVTESLAGPVNAVSPQPVTNGEFTKALAVALHRPAVLPVPKFAVRVALGELADALLLASTRVVPEKLIGSGFCFEDTDIRLAVAKNVGEVSILRSEQFLQKPIHDVFPFFASAHNLNHLTPSWLHFEVLNPDVEMKPHALINYRLRMHGVPIRWQSEILDWQPPYRFVDVQRRGPYTLWIHEHLFEERDGGTMVRDVVRYASPGGSIIRRLLVEPDLRKIFNYRRARLAEHFAV